MLHRFNFSIKNRAAKGNNTLYAKKVISRRNGVHAFLPPEVINFRRRIEVPDNLPPSQGGIKRGRISIIHSILYLISQEITKFNIISSIRVVVPHNKVFHAFFPPPPSIDFMAPLSLLHVKKNKIKPIIWKFAMKYTKEKKSTSKIKN